jgi:saccharopine dehydrogenase-like NADP-dependent oxidoreductase
MYEDYGRRFSEIGKTAVIATGSAPGLICVLARRAVRELDRCDTINMFVYEGVEAKRFLPFWWSPISALSDMEDRGYAFENGELIRTDAFSMPVRRKFPELGGLEVDFIEHNHDEPVHMGLNAEKFFKGAKNIYFKYGGVGASFAGPLHRAGLLSKKEIEVKGRKVVPFDLVLAHLPPAPKTAEEIKEIIDEGIVSDTGAFVVEAYGKKNGKNVMVDVHLSAPGLVDAFERSGLTAEMYQTGQGGFLFTKMFVEDKYTQRGLITSDMLTEEQVDYYLDCAAKLDLTLDIKIKEQ